MAEFKPYTSALQEFFNGTQDWDTDDHYCLLLTSAYTPVLTHSTVADVSASEVVEINYSPKDLLGESVTTVGDAIVCDANDVNFGNPVTITTASYVVICVGTAGAKSGTDPLVGYAYIGTPSVSNDEFLVQWDVDGIFRIDRGSSVFLLDTPDTHTGIPRFIRSSHHTHPYDEPTITPTDTFDTH